MNCEDNAAHPISGSTLGCYRLCSNSEAPRSVAMTSPNAADWKLTAGNIRNLLHGFSPDAIEVEVVNYGPGIAMVRKDSAASADIQDLEKEGVSFIACENSMRHMQMTKADLIPGVGTVPYGIVEVIKKEEAG